MECSSPIQVWNLIADIPQHQRLLASGRCSNLEWLMAGDRPTHQGARFRGQRPAYNENRADLWTTPRRGL